MAKNENLNQPQIQPTKAEKRSVTIYFPKQEYEEYERLLKSRIGDKSVASRLKGLSLHDLEVLSDKKHYDF